MTKNYKYLIKSVLFIAELSLVFVIHIYILNNHLRNFIQYRQSNDISQILYIVYLIPLFLILRIFLQNFKIVSTIIFLLQNIIIFNVSLLDKVYLQNDLIKMYVLGVILNILFYLLDYFCIRSIDKMFDR